MGQQNLEKEKEAGLKQVRLNFLTNAGYLIADDRVDQSFDMLDNFIGSVDRDSSVYRELLEFRDSVHKSISDAKVKLKQQQEKNLRIPEGKDSYDSEIYFITRKGCRALYDYCFANALKFDLIPKE
ncbi:MAG: hypothetical protein H7836_14605 [Magnetococcus sp. YQC-3]